eukprot:gene22177-155_t
MVKYSNFSTPADPHLGLPGPDGQNSLECGMTSLLFIARNLGSQTKTSKTTATAKKTAEPDPPEKTCSTCQKSITNNNFYVPGCGHVFHRTCHPRSQGCMTCTDRTKPFTSTAINDFIVVLPPDMEENCTTTYTCLGGCAGIKRYENIHYLRSHIRNKHIKPQQSDMASSGSDPHMTPNDSASGSDPLMTPIDMASSGSDPPMTPNDNFDPFDTDT